MIVFVFSDLSMKDNNSSSISGSSTASSSASSSQTQATVIENSLTSASREHPSESLSIQPIESESPVVSSDFGVGDVAKHDDSGSSKK